MYRDFSTTGRTLKISGGSPKIFLAHWACSDDWVPGEFGALLMVCRSTDRKQKDRTTEFTYNKSIIRYAQQKTNNQPQTGAEQTTRPVSAHVLHSSQNLISPVPERILINTFERTLHFLDNG